LDCERRLLTHFLAALAYRTQKAPRDAPLEFFSFRAGPQVPTPQELIRHMDSVLGYARTFFIGGAYRPPEFPQFAPTLAHFHEILEDLARHIEQGTEFQGITAETMLQGPFSDAMTTPANYSGTRVSVSRKQSLQVDATIRARRPRTTLIRPRQLWFRSRHAAPLVRQPGSPGKLHLRRHQPGKSRPRPTAPGSSRR